MKECWICRATKPFYDFYLRVEDDPPIRTCLECQDEIIGRAVSVLEEVA